MKVIVYFCNNQKVMEHRELRLNYPTAYSVYCNSVLKLGEVVFISEPFKDTIIAFAITHEYNKPSELYNVRNCLREINRFGKALTADAIFKTDSETIKEMIREEIFSMNVSYCDAK